MARVEGETASKALARAVPLTTLRLVVADGRVPGTSEDPFPKVKGRTPRLSEPNPTLRNVEEMDMAGYPPATLRIAILDN